MKKINIFVIVCVMVIATSTLAFSGSPNLVSVLFGAVDTESQASSVSENNSSENQTVKTAKANFNSVNSAPTSPSTIPNHVLYEQLFRMIVSVTERAKFQEVFEPQQQNYLRFYFKNKLQLTDEQNRGLEKTAYEFMDALEPIDAQAKDIISQSRTAFPEGRVPAGSTVPEPPIALADLQEKRNLLALQFRDQLQKELGETVFQQFDQFIEQDFASGFQPLIEQ